MATTVTASNALARPAPNQWTVTANAGSYSTAADTSPLPANTAYGPSTVWTRDQAIVLGRKRA